MTLIPWKDYANNALQLVGETAMHMGREHAQGFDCVGIAHYAARAAGLDAGPTIHYGPDPSPDDLQRGLAEFADKCSNPRTAHIWQIRVPGGPRHVAIPAYDIDGERVVCVMTCNKRGRVRQVALRPENAAGWLIRGIQPRPCEVFA